MEKKNGERESETRIFLNTISFPTCLTEERAKCPTCTGEQMQSLPFVGYAVPLFFLPTHLGYSVFSVHKVKPSINFLRTGGGNSQ